MAQSALRNLPLERMNARRERAGMEAFVPQAPTKTAGQAMADMLGGMSIPLSFVPVAGDVAGLAADAAMYATRPEERTLGNAAMTLAGIVPGIPGAAAMRAGKQAAEGALDMSQAARMQRAKDQGYNVDDFYTHAGGDVPEIKKTGLFDGIFAQAGTGSTHYGGVQNQFILKRPIARMGDQDFDEQKAILTLKRAYPKMSDDEIELLYEFTAKDKNIFDADTNPLERYGFSDLGEASWEAQRLRGRIAADQGFDAVEMDDEYGTSYLIPFGSQARRIDDKFIP